MNEVEQVPAEAQEPTEPTTEQTVAFLVEQYSYDVPIVQELSDSDANWVTRLILKEDENIKAAQNQFEGEVARLRAKMNEMTEASKSLKDALVRYYAPLLQDYAKKRLAGQRGRSVKLLEGTLGFRKEADKVSIVDQEQILAWAKAHMPEVVKVSEVVQVSTIKENAVKDINDEKDARLLCRDNGQIVDIHTGEVVPGLEYVQGSDQFYIK